MRGAGQVEVEAAGTLRVCKAAVCRSSRRLVAARLRVAMNHKRRNGLREAIRKCWISTSVDAAIIHGNRAHHNPRTK